ncbi:MAG: hypothetical protein FJ264_15725 [Planctomycetes bacterium]|nr:hypothetical protein [Planctomycetota bacterium]
MKAYIGRGKCLTRNNEKDNLEMKKADIFVGTSGFTYDHWGDGVFYPEGLSKHKWLEYYS